MQRLAETRIRHEMAGTELELGILDCDESGFGVGFRVDGGHLGLKMILW